MLTLSENNEEDTEELFAHKQFHVVGTVNSPYYANYERGTTSLGNRNYPRVHAGAKGYL